MYSNLWDGMGYSAHSQPECIQAGLCRNAGRQTVPLYYSKRKERILVEVKSGAKLAESSTRVVREFFLEIHKSIFLTVFAYLQLSESR